MNNMPPQVLLLALLTCALLTSATNTSEGSLSNQQSVTSAIGFKTLKYVSVIARHGSRTPLSTFPTDTYPYNNTKYWPDGPDQLTKVGKQQLFRVGQILRQRYNGFLNVNYYPNETLVLSNLNDRDYMSAALLVAGLYPPTGYQMWNENLNWQPIPIYPDQFDVIELFYNNELCPKYTKVVRKSLNEVFKHIKKQTDFIRYVSGISGLTDFKLYQLFTIMDAILMQRENGFPLPAWTNNSHFETLKSGTLAIYQGMVCASTTIKRLTAGPVLKMIVEQLISKSRGELIPNRKFFIDAVHDFTISAVLCGIDIQERILIESGSFIAFELHGEGAEYYVKVLYFKYSDAENPRLLEIPSCGTQCTLEEFNDVVQKYIPSDWDDECKIPIS